MPDTYLNDLPACFSPAFGKSYSSPLQSDDLNFIAPMFRPESVDHVASPMLEAESIDLVPLPCCFTPQKYIVSDMATNCQEDEDYSPVKASKIRKKLCNTGKRKKEIVDKPGVSTAFCNQTNQTKPRAEVHVKRDGKKAYVCTFTWSRFGDDYAKLARTLCNDIEARNLSAEDAKLQYGVMVANRCT